MDRALPAEWRVSEPARIAETATSHVFRVRLADGRTAIVKDLKPIGVEDELRGSGYLAWRDGAGAVRLIARSGSTLLLEDAGDQSLLGHLDRHGDRAATAILIEVAAALHAASVAPHPSDLQPLAARFASLFALDVEAGGVLAQAARVAHALLDNQRDVRPLHGDLHHENVLHGERGWLAIDPKGLLGDPAYDAANSFCNPLRRDDLRTDPDRIRSMARGFAEALDRDPVAVLRWAFAHACLSASWHLADGNRVEAARSLGVATAVRAVIASDDSF